MPGTILLDDLRDSVEDQLHQHVTNLLQQAQAVGQQVVQPVQAAAGLVQAPPPIQAPDAGQVLQALQQHVDNITQAPQQALQVLGGGAQAAGGALTTLGTNADQVRQSLLDHVDNITQQAQGGLQTLNKPPLAQQAPTLGAAETATPELGAPSAPPPDRSASLRDYARGAAQRAGIDPEIFARQIQQESGFDPTAKSLAGALGVAQFMPDTAKGVGVDPTDPYASLDAAARMDAQNLSKYNGDWSKTLAAYNAGSGNVDKYGGVPPFEETQRYVKTILTGPTTAQARAKDLGYTDVSQFGDSQLTSAEAYAACGPAAAVRFAERFGRNPTLREATDLAKQVGWTEQGGMAGLGSEQKLMTNLGIDTKVVGRDWQAYAKEAQTGNPVTISTPGHYFYADGYNAESGAFHVGRSGLDLKNGSEWMTPAQMENLMGTADGALFSNNPNVPTRGSTTSSNEAAPPPAIGPKAPLVADQSAGPLPIQSMQDVLGAAAERARSAVGQVASDLGSAAQGVVQGAQELNRVQPGTEAVRAITPVLGGAAQQVGQTAQDINRLQPGTAAVAAATPVLGGADQQAQQSLRDLRDNPLMPSNVLGGAERAAGNVISNIPDTLGAAQRATEGLPRVSPLLGLEQLPAIRQALLPTIFDPGVPEQMQQEATLALSATNKMLQHRDSEVTDEERQALDAMARVIGGTEMPELSPEGLRGLIGRGGQDVLHGQAVPRPGYEPGTPEHTTETFLQAQARAQGTATPNITGADIGGLPGMAGTRMRGLQEVRDAVDAGLPAARWYQEIVKQIRQDTGQDINPREAAVLMGAFGGNAGVTPNYHAMLSVFDAMRQAKPDLAGFENMTPEQVQATQAFKDVAALVHGDASYADDSMLARVMRGYRTGEIPVPSGAKLSSYTQDFLHALQEQYVPYSTQDVHQGRLFGARPDIQGGNGLPNVSQSDAAYRTMHALTNWVARERNLPPDQAQAAAWTVFRTLWNDKTIGPELRNDRIGLSDAIRQGQQSGVLNPQTLATGGLAEVTAPRTAVPTSWISKLNDVRDRIKQNGSFNAPPPESATAVNEMGLYHPSIQSAAEQRAVLDPSGFQYGTVSGPKVGVRRPVGNEPAASLRELALADRPVLRVPGEVPLDANGKIPWLAAEHDVQRAGDRTYVSVAGVGDDAAHLIGQRLGADRFNHADPTSTTPGGLRVSGLTTAEQSQLSRALEARGLPTVRGATGSEGVRVPLLEGKVADLARSVQQTMNDEALRGTLLPYTGATHAVESAGQGRAGSTGNLRGSAAGRLGVPAGNDLRRQQLAASLFRDAQLPGSATGGLRGARESAQSTAGFGLNVGGAVAGGVAGNVATPENATPEERLRNIALGAGAGLAAGRMVPRAIEGGFRAPRIGDLAELVRSERGEVPIVPGEQLPPERPAPRSLSEVQSNRWALREPRPGETPMSEAERSSYYDTLDQRIQQVQQRFDAVDEMLNNPNQKPERPPWAAGYTNDQIVELARRHDISAYEPLWWEKVGLEAGSGEVRENVGQSGIRRGSGQRDPTPAELRAERNDLSRERRDLMAAGDQLINAPPGQDLVRATPERPDLPFDRGTAETPAEGRGGPYATEHPGAPAGTLATDIVTRNGTKDYGNPLQEGPGQVIGRKGEVTGRGISDVEAAHVGEPSAQTKFLMPNLDAMLKGEMPEVRAQIQKAAEDNPELMAAYQQGRISRDSVMADLANKVGMSKAAWLKTKVGQGFSTPELAALQAAAIDAQGQSKKLATDIVAKGGVDALTPEEVAHSLTTLVDNSRLLAVARGGRASAGRSLNILKERLSATMAQGINASNEAIAAQRVKAQATAASKRATQQLEQVKLLDAEQKQAVTSARAQGAPNNILQRISDAYDQLDRYQAMSLHEKADDYNALKAARDAAAAKRQDAIREPPQELLSALQAELKAERDNFAKRKDTWETMAFWDSKANENVAEKRNAFRGGLYIEQFRKSAELAAQQADQQARRAFDLDMRRRTIQQDKASTLLEAVGGQVPSRELLANYVEAINNDDPMVAAKFIKGLQDPGWWGKSQILRLAGLLSSTATHMANTTGNITQPPLKMAEHALVVPIDWARAKVTGGERQAYMEELGPMAGSWGGGFMSALPQAIKVLQTGISPQTAAEISRGKLGRPGFASGSGKLDAAVEMPLRALEAEDQLFRGGAFAMEANRVATNFAKKEGFAGAQLAGRTQDIIANLESYPDLYTQAYQGTQRMLFQEKRTVPLLNQIPTKGVPGAIVQGGVSQVLPFKSTPANITAQGFGLSPLGVSGVLEALANRRNLRPDQLGQQTLLAEQRIARTAIGTAIMGGFLALGYGTFTGGKSMLTGAYDPEEASTYPQGYREWSMATSDPVTGNTYYIPFQNFGAAGAPMAMAAILTDAHRRGKSIVDGDEAVRASTAIGQYILDNTFLQGLSDTVNVLHDPSQYAPKFVESLVSSYGPYSAMGRQIQRSMGVASRNPRQGFQGLVDAMEAAYPGLSSNVPEATTPLGEPRTQGISGIASFALPVRADISRDEPTLAALRAADVRIPAAAKAVNVGNGWSIDLTEAEQDQVKRARGQYIREQVARAQDLPMYKNGDVSVRNQVLSQAVSNGAQTADVLFVRSLPQGDLQARAVRRSVPTPYTIAEAS